MQYSLSTTALLIVDSEPCDRWVSLSAGNFSTAVSVYLRWAGTKNVIRILNAAGLTQMTLRVRAGNRVEAYTNAGTADIAVNKVGSHCRPEPELE